MAEVSEREIDLLARVILLKKDVAIERDRSLLWRALAGRYDDIRDALRNCEDNPAGHTEFYRACCRLIFGDDEESDE